MIGMTEMQVGRRELNTSLGLGSGMDYDSGVVYGGMGFGSSYEDRMVLNEGRRDLMQGQQDYQMGQLELNAGKIDIQEGQRLKQIAMK